MGDGVDKQTGKGKGKRLSTRVSRRRTATEPGPTCSNAQDAAVALSDGDAQSLARFFRGLLPPAANYGGPQHVCLKRAFALMDSRWEMSADETFPITAATMTAGGGTGEPPLAFSSNDSKKKKKKSLLSPELFAHVVGFLNQQHALRTTWTCKAWWRNVSGLPLAAHLNLCNLHSRRTPPQSSTEANMGWQDMLNLLRHIKSRNPHRVVRRLTLNDSVKLGSMANLSSATAGLLTHVDFSRARSSGLSFHQIGVNMPGLRGLGVRETLYTSNNEWAKSLAKLVSVVSLESLRVCAVEYGRSYGDPASGGVGTIPKNDYICRLDDPFLVTLAAAGDSLRKLWLVTAFGESADVEGGMITLGAAVPNLEVLTTDSLKVTDRGWAVFAAARLASKRYLVSICIKAPGATHVPCEATRAVLMDAVRESLLLYSSPSGVRDGLPLSPPSTLVDCEGRPVAVGLCSDKLCVTSGGPWKSNDASNADDL